MIVGYIFLQKLPIDYYPKVEIPTITVNTVYRGASPTEIESQVTKPLEDAISTVPGIFYLRSFSQENISIIVIEFDLEVDIKFSLNQIRDRIGLIRKDLPEEINEPLINIFDLSALPLITANIISPLAEGEIYHIVEDVIKPQLTQIPNIGQIDIRRIPQQQIQIRLDRDRLYKAGLSVTQVEQNIIQGGKNIPLGNRNNQTNDKNLIFRSMAEYETIEDMKKIPIFSPRNNQPKLLGEIAEIKRELEKPTQISYLDGKKSYIIELYRQSGANDIEVSDGIQRKIESLNADLKKLNQNIQIYTIKDSSEVIRGNIDDVKHAIYLGIILTIIVVFLFLGSARSTLITGLAIPNSILGAFIVMALAGFTINIMTLLSLSLAVGLLIDDAIVVRENIHRHRQKLGKSLRKSAVDGTAEVSVAVIATTLCIIAVFAPIAFIEGIVGQFLKEFGLTVCFAMLISLFDALTMAPMLSASLPNWKSKQKRKAKFFWLWQKKEAFFQKLEDFQVSLEKKYIKVLRHVIAFPLRYLISGSVIFFGSLTIFNFIPITFVPPQDQGEIYIDFDLPPGTSLDKMEDFSLKMDSILRQEKEITSVFTNIGNTSGNANEASIYLKLVDRSKRNQSTSEYKEHIRKLLLPFKESNPRIGDGSIVSGTSREYNLNLIGTDLKQLEKYAIQFVDKISDRGVLIDINTNIRAGHPEFQVKILQEAVDDFAVSPNLVGSELRYYIQGKEIGKHKILDKNREFTLPIHLKIKDEQSNLENSYNQIYVPNAQFIPIPLNKISEAKYTSGPSTIYRINRTRFIQVSAEVDPTGPGMNGALQETENILNGELDLPSGISYQYYGQAHLFNEMLRNMIFAVGIGILAVYLVLCSLYGSFITPLTIMLVLPLAVSGALIGLWLFNESLNLFSIIACIMLLGLATKNSILLVNYANQLREKKKSYADAIIAAGRIRLRPILMTSIALIAGTIPIAIGLTEVAKQRTSMGVAIIGGTISSTILSLLIIPAAYSYIDRFDKWVKKKFYQKEI